MLKLLGRAIQVVLVSVVVIVLANAWGWLETGLLIVAVLVFGLNVALFEVRDMLLELLKQRGQGHD